MNEGHLKFLASPEWAEMLQTDLLPWLLRVAELGDDILEIGPGPGLTTDMLRERAAKVTAIELDENLASSLARRLAGTNVEVVRGDASASGLPSDRFSAVTCFSALHHMPSHENQDQLFSEVVRVLRPGGCFVGVDAVDIDMIRQGHDDDTFTPVDPGTLPSRLEAAGLTDVSVEVGAYQIHFHAAKPPSSG